MNILGFSFISFLLVFFYCFINPFLLFIKWIMASPTKKANKGESSLRYIFY